MRIQHYRPAFLQASQFKFMLINLSHCDGLKRLNPNIIFFMVGLSRHIELSDKCFCPNLMGVHIYDPLEHQL